MAAGGRRERGGAFARWSLASAILVAGAGVGMTGARASVLGSWEGAWDDAKWPQRSAVERLRPTDELEWAGLGAVVIALAFIASTPYFARSWRRIAVHAGCALFFGVGGYALYDHRDVALNLYLLGNRAALRADCERLMGRRGRLVYSIDYPLSSTELPASMQRLQITTAVVNRYNVLMFYSPSGGPGILYDPGDPDRRWMLRAGSVQRTWFEGFYKYDGFTQ